MVRTRRREPVIRMICVEKVPLVHTGLVVGVRDDSGLPGAELCKAVVLDRDVCGRSLQLDAIEPGAPSAIEKAVLNICVFCTCANSPG